MSRPARRKGDANPVTFETARRLALALPGTEERPSYGTPGFRAGGKLFARFHQDGDALVVRVDEAERSMRMRADPETYYITDHYAAHPWVLVRLDSIREEELRELLADAWRRVAPGRLIARREGE